MEVSNLLNDEFTVLDALSQPTVANVGPTSATLSCVSLQTGGSVYLSLRKDRPWYSLDNGDDPALVAADKADIIAGTKNEDIVFAESTPATPTPTIEATGLEHSTPFYAGWVSHVSDVVSDVVFYTGVAPYTFSRADVDSAQSGLDFQGAIRLAAKNNALHYGSRVVENLATGVTTETIDVEVGSQYVITIKGDNNATAELSGAVTDTLTANGTNRITHDNGTPVVASATSLTVLVTGTLTELLVEDVSGSYNKNPSEYTQTNAAHLSSNGNTVDSGGVVIEVEGHPFYETYFAVIYGDSLTDSMADDVDIGDTLNPNTDWRFHTLGVSGAKLDAINTTLQATLPDSGDNTVLLQGGVNDVQTATVDPNTLMRSSMSEMVATAEGLGAKIICIPIAPWGGWGTWTATKQGYGDAYNAWLEATYPLYFVDIYEKLEDPANLTKLLPIYDKGDGLHLSPEGSEAIDEEIQKLLPYEPFQGVSIEGPRTNLIDWSDDMREWSAPTEITVSWDGTLLRGRPANLLVDEGTASRNISRTIGAGYTQDTTFAASVLLKGVTDTSCTVVLRRGTPGAWLTVREVKLDGPGTFVTSADALVIVSGLSTTKTTRLTFLADMVPSESTAASFHIYPTGTATLAGSVYVAAMQAEIAGFSSSFIKAKGEVTERPATQLSASMSELLLPDDLLNNLSGAIQVRPRFNHGDVRSQRYRIIELYADATNSFSIEYDNASDQIIFNKTASGVTTSAAVSTGGYNSGDLLNIRYTSSSISGLSLLVNDNPEGTDTGLAPLSAPITTVYLGSTDVDLVAFHTVEQCTVWPEVKEFDYA